MGKGRAMSLSLLQFTTDYVFSGNLERPNREDDLTVQLAPTDAQSLRVKSG